MLLGNVDGGDWCEKVVRVIVVLWCRGMVVIETLRERVQKR